MCLSTWKALHQHYHFWSLFPFTLIFEGGRSELPVGRKHPSLPLVICFSEPGFCAAQTLTKAQVLHNLIPCKFQEKQVSLYDPCRPCKNLFHLALKDASTTFPKWLRQTFGFGEKSLISSVKR